MRFSLRTLLLFVTIVALLLAAWYGYRRAKMCQVKWIEVNSAEAAALFPTAQVERLDDGSYGFTYYARHRHMQSLGRVPRIRNAGGSVSIDGQTIEVSTDDEASAQIWLEALRAADTLQPGIFVIRGRVIDQKGKPLARATVDLMGSFVFINHFHTRDDGTFTLPLDDGGMSAPAGSGYFLRVRAREETAEQLARWHTPRFSLKTQQPERVMLIVVPR